MLTMDLAAQAEKVVLEDQKMIYVTIPKTGCTSVKQFFTNHFGWRVVENVHNPQSEIYQHIQHIDISGQAFADYFKFTFVRHPLSRVHSCFRDKIKPGIRHPWWIDGVERGLHAMGIRAHHSFDEFLEILARTSDEKADPHVRSQHTFIFTPSGQLVVDQLFRFEAFKKGMAVLQDKLNESSMAIPHKNRSARDPTQFLRAYSPYGLDLAVQRYEADFRLLGYNVPSLDTNGQLRLS